MKFPSENEEKIQQSQGVLLEQSRIVKNEIFYGGQYVQIGVF